MELWESDGGRVKRTYQCIMAPCLVLGPLPGCQIDSNVGVQPAGDTQRNRGILFRCPTRVRKNPLKTMMISVSWSFWSWEFCDPFLWISVLSPEYTLPPSSSHNHARVIFHFHDYGRKGNNSMISNSMINILPLSQMISYIEVKVGAGVYLRNPRIEGIKPGNIHIPIGSTTMNHTKQLLVEPL